MDQYNLSLLTRKLTENARPSKAATLHALVCLACRQHGIDPLEEDPQDKEPPVTADPLQICYKQSQHRARRREELLSRTEGNALIDLSPKL